MPTLKDTRAMVAKRVRELATRLSDPAEIKAAETFADELERRRVTRWTAVKKRIFFIGKDENR